MTPAERPARPPLAEPERTSEPACSVRGASLAGRRITLCVTGSIAAYKACIIARLLVKEGAQVRTVLTHSAEHFVGRATFAGITGMPTMVDMFDPGASGESHVTLAAATDLVLVAPATADMLARLASGRADDTVTAICLSARCPVLVAPAMHSAMWSHPATERNVATLAADGRVERVGPVHGEVASGEVGEGRMAEPEQIVARVKLRLGCGDLCGRHLVVTAGPTVEDLDPVRFVSNRSSGKMGFALAERAALRGARVTLVAGPVVLATPEGVERVNVRSAIDMREAVWEALGADLAEADALLMAAAVADYRPAQPSSDKLRRESSTLLLELVQNPDILGEVGGARRAGLPVLVGFALETESDERAMIRARQKLEYKRVDLVVANHPSDALERDDNRATLLDHSGIEPLARMSKGELADRILNWLKGRLGELG
jgi:phosphopantothenoylcysteine decarboxylase/phosphopantothenate--cysteine ligase